MRIFRRALPGLPMFAVGSMLLQVWGASEAVAAERRFLIDFGAETSATPGWNNLYFGSTGSSLTGLVDTGGQSSGLSLQITDGFWQGWVGAYNGAGTTASTLYPATATQDTFFIGTNEGTTDSLAKLRLAGLSATGTYSLRFYASRMTDDQTSDRTAQYTVGAQTVELQARNNINDSALMTGLVPTSGALDITVAMKPGAVFAYLGVLEVIQQDGTSEPEPEPEPSNLPPVANAGADRTVPLPTNTVALQQSFSDPEGQSTTFVWTQVSGPTTARLYQNPWSPLVASNLVQGTYVFRLTVTDAQGASASDDVSVSVVPSTGSGTPFQRTLTEKSVTSNNKVIYYYESLPRGYNTDPNRKWPVLVFHHGIAEKGAIPETLPNVLGNMTLIRDNAPLEFDINGVTESFIVLIPQLHDNYSDWQDFFTQAMIDTAKANLRVDADRVYLMGFSLGAFHTWSFPQRSDANASQIAAIVPFSGGRIYSANGASQVCRLATKNVPVWTFHAVDDHTVAVGTTDSAVNALNACSPAPAPAPRYTRPATGDHWIIGWGASPTQPEGSNIYRWMLQNRRSTTPPTTPLTPRTLTPRMTNVPKLWNGPLGYYESLPRGYDADPNRQWPLLVFLHGAGQRGNGTTELPRTLETALPANIGSGNQLEFTVNGVTESFVVLIPQITADTSGWHPYHVERLLDVAMASYRINPKRVYLTGLSLGGFGTTAFVEFSQENANRIAAIAPTDGAHYGGLIWTPDRDNVTTNACYLAQADVKVWQFYGQTDGWAWTVTDFLARLSACAPPTPTKVTRYDGLGHEAYTRAYVTNHQWHDPNLYEWLLAQQRP
ncbi:hypothetical protein LZ198_32745 [Myxococcus sp. K15C18031901]|uniref:carboxylesterase family protein n=1 Tax=Myxococcus dinghuensis TaxID=2906761 RepID=UPI0020A773F0|nr:hypothetical protein [Myxococcus dinghuensis]MCP3103663.1 hypothetical protein [Myxococcus dinghuensis]